MAWPSRWRYQWDDWMDGSIWQCRQGVDWPDRMGVEEFRTRAINHASRHGMLVTGRAGYEVNPDVLLDELAAALEQHRQDCIYQVSVIRVGYRYHRHVPSGRRSIDHGLFRVRIRRGTHPDDTFIHCHRHTHPVTLPPLDAYPLRRATLALRFYQP